MIALFETVFESTYNFEFRQIKIYSKYNKKYIKIYTSTHHINSISFVLNCNLPCHRKFLLFPTSINRFIYSLLAVVTGLPTPSVYLLNSPYIFSSACRVYFLYIQLPVNYLLFLVSFLTQSLPTYTTSSNFIPTVNTIRKIKYGHLIEIHLLNFKFAIFTVLNTLQFWFWTLTILLLCGELP